MDFKPFINNNFENDKKLMTPVTTPRRSIATPTSSSHKKDFIQIPGKINETTSD